MSECLLTYFDTQTEVDHMCPDVDQQQDTLLLRGDEEEERCTESNRILPPGSV